MVSKTLSALALMAAAANAGSFTVQNSCSQQTLYYWITQAQQAGQPDTGLTQGPFSVAPGATGSPEQYIQLATGGVSVAFNTVDNIVGSQLLEYSYYGDNVANWFDLSDINGTPFSEGGFMVVPSQISAGNCHGITCCAGTSKCPVVYNVWDSDTTVGPDNPMADCMGYVDLTFIACPSGAGGAPAQTYQNAGCPAPAGSAPVASVASSAAAAASPVSAPANSVYQNAKQPVGTPVAEAPAVAVEVVTMVSTVTIFDKRAEATPEAEAVKRHMHQHAHAHGHH